MHKIQCHNSLSENVQCSTLNKENQAISPKYVDLIENNNIFFIPDSWKILD